MASTAHPSYPLLQMYFKQTAVAAARHVKHLPRCETEYFVLGKTYPAPGVWKNYVTVCKGIYKVSIGKVNNRLYETVTDCTKMETFLLRNRRIFTADFVNSPETEAPLCRQHRSTAPRAHNTGALLFFIHGVQSRFPDIFHTLPPETHIQRRRLEGHLQSRYTQKQTA